MSGSSFRRAQRFCSVSLRLAVRCVLTSNAFTVEQSDLAYPNTSLARRYNIDVARELRYAALAYFHHLLRY